MAYAGLKYVMVESFRIIPEFRILKLTFYKVSLTMLNSARDNSFSDLVSVYLEVFDY